MKLKVSIFVCILNTLLSAQATFHGNNARTGVFVSPGPKHFGRIKWTFSAGTPVLTSPAIADGVVYVGAMDGHLYAIDEQTGKAKWNYKSSMPIESSPAVSGGILYVVSSAGALVAIDVNNGKSKWILPMEFERKFEAKGLHGLMPASQTIPDGWDVFTSSPAVADGKVYFGSADGNLYAADAQSGILLWKFATGDVLHSSPAVVGTTVYFGSWDSYFYAVDTLTGQKKWSFKSGEDNNTHNQVGFQGSAAIANDTVYVGCRDSHVYALAAATGRKKWDYPTSGSWVVATPAVKDGVVYVGTSDSARFMALDARTGRLDFNFNARSFNFSSPALAGDLAYFGDHNGRMYAVNIKTGNEEWEYQTEASKKDPLKLLNQDGTFNDSLFAPVFGDFEDMYIAISRFNSVGAILSSPVIDRGVLYFGSMDGNVYAIE